MNFFIADINEQLVGVLSTDEYGAHTPIYSATVEEKLSSYDVLTFTIPADSEEAKLITEEGYVFFEDEKGWREYVVNYIEDIDGEVIERSVSGELSSIEMYDDILDKELAGKYNNPEELLREVLAVTRWEVGNVDVSIYNKTFNLSTENKSVLEVLSMIADSYSCEVQFSYQVDSDKISKRLVNLYKQFGQDNGKRFEVDKDITEVKRTVDSKGIKTAIIPTGKSSIFSEGEEGDESDAFTIEDIEWSVANGDPADKPLGQKWLGNPIALNNWGRKNVDGTLRHRFRTVEMDVDSPNQLISMAWVQLGRYVNPKVTYEVTAQDLYTLTGDEDLKHEYVRLGDVVSIIDNYFAEPLQVMSRAIEITRDLLNPLNNKLVLGESKATLNTEDVKDQIEEVRRDVTEDIKQVYANLSDIQFNLDGQTKTYRGSNSPVGMTEGDIWFRPHPAVPNEKQMLVYNGTSWDLEADSSELADAGRLRTGVLDAGRVNVINLTADNINGGNLNLANGLKVVNGPHEVLKVNSATGEVAMNVTSLKVNAFDAITSEDLNDYARIDDLKDISGIEGPQGPAGKSSYTHIAYANSEDGVVDFSTSNSANRAYIGMYVDDVLENSTVPSRYNWTLIKGQDGKNGLAGPKGENGQTPYLHIAYANLDDYEITSVNLINPNNISNNKTIITSNGLNGTGSFTTNSTRIPIDRSLIYKLGRPVNTGTLEIFLYRDSTFLSHHNLGTAKDYKINFSNYSTTANRMTFRDSSNTTSKDYFFGEFYGNNFSTTDSTGRSHIGVYTDFNIGDSESMNDYTWSLIKGEDGSDGYVPIKGVDYFDGIDGQDGHDGSSSYLWVRYSQNESGLPMSTSPYNAKYIGIATTQSSTPPSHNLSYTWTLIKGEDGVAGEKGSDGQTSYLHIKYSNDGGTSFTANNGEAVGSWIGTYVDFVEGDSLNVSDYTWNKVVGPQGERGLAGLQGPKGEQGVRGKDGEDGQASYTHIAYADNETGSLNFSHSNPDRAYMGVYVDNKLDSSSDPQKYNWSMIKGADGENGVQGPAGLDGKTPYFHTAWANSADGTVGFDLSNSTDKIYIGTYTDFVEKDSTDPASYNWVRIKGETGNRGLQGLQGPQGNQGIRGPAGHDGESSYVHIAWADSADGSVNFSTSLSDNRTYIGMYTDNIELDSNNPALYHWTLIKGQDGADGIQGKAGVDGQTPYLHIAYANNSTGTSGFSTTVSTDKIFIGTYTDFTKADSSDPTKYKWVRIKGDTGLQGLQGPQGNQGIQGAKGADGSSSYTHIAYADNATGTVNFSHSNPDRDYIGMYVDDKPESSSVASKYKWTLVKGQDGENGVQGPKGADGQTPYFHTAWANNSTGTSGFSTTISTDKLFIGTYTDFVEADSTDPTKYKWTKIKGDTGPQGPQGNQGVQGPKGTDGKTYYTWVKYATTPTSGMSDSPTGKVYIGLAYNKESITESTVYSDYTWSLIKGESGATGPKGADGTTTYTWIKYADTITGAGMSNSPIGKKFLGLAYNKTTATESNTASHYTWSAMYDEEALVEIEGNIEDLNEKVDELKRYTSQLNKDYESGNPLMTSKADKDAVVHVEVEGVTNQFISSKNSNMAPEVSVLTQQLNPTVGSVNSWFHNKTTLNGNVVTIPTGTAHMVATMIWDRVRAPLTFSFDMVSGKDYALEFYYYDANMRVRNDSSGNPSFGVSGSVNSPTRVTVQTNQLNSSIHYIKAFIRSAPTQYSVRNIMASSIGNINFFNSLVEGPTADTPRPLNKLNSSFDIVSSKHPKGEVDLKDIAYNSTSTMTTFGVYKTRVVLANSLLSLGGKRDRLFKDSDARWKVEKNIGEYTFTGAETWSLISSSDLYARFSVTLPNLNIGGTASQTNCSSNMFKGVDQLQLSSREIEGISTQYLNSTMTVNVKVFKDRLPVSGTANGMKEYMLRAYNSSLSGTGVAVTMQYLLKDPQYTALSTTYQNQLNSIRTFEGDNYVYTVANFNPKLSATFKSKEWYDTMMSSGVDKSISTIDFSANNFNINSAKTRIHGNTNIIGMVQMDNDLVVGGETDLRKVKATVIKTDEIESTLIKGKKFVIENNDGEKILEIDGDNKSVLWNINYMSIKTDWGYEEIIGGVGTGQKLYEWRVYAYSSTDSVLYEEQEDRTWFGLSRENHASPVPSQRYQDYLWFRL